MRSRKPFIIMWPQYFEAKKTRSEGRRLPQNLAVDKITIKEIVNAANKLGYEIQVEPHLKYPREWWETSGRILVNTKGKKKSKVLKEIAKEIRKSRG
jgi:signal recognition particle subunit SRP19